MAQAVTDRIGEKIILAAVRLTAADQLHAAAAEVHFEPHRVEAVRRVAPQNLCAATGAAPAGLGGRGCEAERVRRGEGVIVDEPQPVGAARRRLAHAEIRSPGEPALSSLRT
ncbi:MAG: hypothetical protein AB7V27_16355 [Candidatus Binatia bacterium]